MGIDRRQFIKIAGLSTLFGLGGKIGWEFLKPGQVEAALEAAPLTAKRWAMVIDMRKLDDATAQQWAARFSGHSLRAGHVTAAAAAGVPEWVILRQTGHTRIETLRAYIRLGSLWLENSAARLGL